MKVFFNGLLANSEYQKKILHFIFFAKTNILKGEFQTLFFYATVFNEMIFVKAQ